MVAMITSMILLPLVGALLIALCPAGRSGWHRSIAWATVLGMLLGAWRMVQAFDPAASGPQWSRRMAWLPQAGIEFFVGVDGWGLVMVLLVPVVGLLALISAPALQGKSRLFFGLILAQLAALIGVFTALNFFHWFLYWELALVPMVLLIGIYGGGSGDTMRVAIRFLVATAAGSLPMLAGFLWIFVKVGTLDLLTLAALAQNGELAARLGDANGIIFWMVLVGLAVKLPLLPLHFWLPSTYERAPVAGTILLSGLMSKMGVFGLWRVLLPIFPEAAAQNAHVLTWVAVATAIFAALCSLAQRDLKRMLAYSSLGHVALCAMGVFAAASAGADLQIARVSALQGSAFAVFSHGLVSAGLFVMGSRIFPKGSEDWDMESLGGCRTGSPALAWGFATMAFASLGLPPMSGFIGEFLVFRGAFPLQMVAAGTGSLALILTAAYMIRAHQTMFWGEASSGAAKTLELTWSEKVGTATLVLAVLALGLFPGTLLNLCYMVATTLSERFS
jgi:NADH-quinone oxidoreductase subunit M